jgi:hypothetical protein
MLSREDETSLIDLSWHWADAYCFDVTDGVWKAVPAGDPAGPLTAASAWELRELVRADYAERQSATGVTGYLPERMST